MKISLRWLFDHIAGDVTKVDVSALVDQFNLKVAEIENFSQLTLDIQNFVVAKAVSVGDRVQLFAPELDQDIFAPVRSDLQIGNYYLLINREKNYDWASGKDFNSLKEGLLPALYFANEQQAKLWRLNFEAQDYIFEVDNKSLTHRPDMWGHRGFAREIAALLNLELKPLEQLITPLSIAEVTDKNSCMYQTKIQAEGCLRFASLYLPKVSNLPSSLSMAVRLFRCDMRAINHLVDLTNYVMLDLGQPMHVFDAKQIVGNQLVVRKAINGEKLALLGGQVLELTAEDMVIADQSGPLSLAGIKGGASSGCTDNTSSILIEAANFDAVTIRKSAARYKIRTESSARFEKTLDPNFNTQAIERFIKLQQSLEPDLKIIEPIVSLGAKNDLPIIRFSHQFVEKRLGQAIPSQFVIDTLNKLGFSITTQAHDYIVQVPSYRASKDVAIAEDVLEEILRMWGYGNILPQMPSKITQPGNLDHIFKIRQIRQYLSAALGMHEVENYPFYDESFLQQINWQPQQAVEIKNPVSENWRRLVTSLIPHLCKNIEHNSHDLADLRFFEWGRIWQPKDAKSATELRILAGVVFNQQIDFYFFKAKLQALFNALGIDVIWQKPTSDLPIWYHAHQTASLMYNGKQIGIAGMLSPDWLEKIALGQAFGFEIDGDFILNQVPKLVKHQLLSKYQATSLDVSILVPLNKTVADLQTSILKVDGRIYQVELVDSFKKDDWQNQKALTFRYYFVDANKTLASDDVFSIQKQVEQSLQTDGAKIR